MRPSPAAFLRFLVLAGAVALLGTHLTIGASRPETGTLKVRLLDPAGKVTPARVNVIGADHAYYEPASNPLADYSLKRKGNRHNRGPARYYGSFFYTDGSFEVRLPPGPARVEVRKGYSYYLANAEATVESGKAASLEIPLRPVVDLRKHGWVSVDTHIHFERARVDDPRFLNLIAAEDVDFGHSISMNSTSKYSPTILSQGPGVQHQGYGPKTHFKKDGTELISGHEYRSANLGHVTQIMIDKLVPSNGMNTDVRVGPAIATIYDQTLEVSGALGHAHGGYDQEILSDIVLGKSDWVELLQFGFYRGIELKGYYLALNSGFRYPIGGASDYPACRTLADCLMYAMGGSRPTFASVTGALLRAESFTSSGPLLFLSVDGRGPGNDLRREEPGEIAVEARAVSSYLPLTELELVMNGKVVASFPPKRPTLELEGRAKIRVEKNSWIAARTHGPQDTRAHTNPVWITFDGQLPFDPAAAKELSRRVDRFRPSRIGPRTKAVLDRAKAKARRIAEERKNPAGPRPNYPRDSEVAPGDHKATPIPPTLPRPPRARPARIEGVVSTAAGEPMAGAKVSARGRGPSGVTDEAGRFVLEDVPVDTPLFLRVEREGFLTTNTSYLNPRASTALQIVCLTPDEAKRQFTAWSKTNKRVRPEYIDSRPTLLIDGVPPAVTVTASPRATEFEAVDAGGQRRILGSVHINFRDSPDEDNSVEPNVVLSLDRLGKDRVVPAFAGQVTYIRVIE